MCQELEVIEQMQMHRGGAGSISGWLVSAIVVVVLIIILVVVVRFLLHLF